MKNNPSMGYFFMRKAKAIALMEAPNCAGSAKSGIHRPYGGAIRCRINKKHHPQPLWRQKKVQDQQKAISIALMETQKGRGSEGSDIHCPYGDTKRRGTRRKRHPQPLWRHKKKRNQQKATSIALMETPKGAKPGESDIHSPYEGAKRRRDPKKASSITPMEAREEAMSANFVCN
jgi:hypothetical protein